MVKQTIKIFARLKPTKKNISVYEIQTDESEKDRLLFAVPRDSNLYINNSKDEFKFQFDHIFERDARQDEIFQYVAQDVIDNCLAGYNGTIFAYGQTGSGKTFTITGGAERYADRGIIPRSLEYLFTQFEKQPHLAFQTHISYLEIYNESGYDLLDPNKEIKKMEDLPKVLLMEDTDGAVHLRNLSLHQANSEEDALNLLFIGDTNRMIAETPMNQASTRSHCIFTIHISSREPGSATIRKAKLHLVDLAGSERVHKTGVNGTLLTEAKYINLSLHFLEQVIVSLSEKSRTHIPYRNSMMTSVLRDSLGGNCMTTMVATLSAEVKNIDESISTCRFAQRVALIKNDVSVNEELDPRLMVAKLKKEVNELKTQLAMGSEDGMMLTEPLSPEELDGWKTKCRKYLDDKDPEAILETGPDLRKILACFKFLKGFYIESTKGVKSLPSSERNSPQQQAILHEATKTHVVPMSAYDSKEVQELKQVLKQRDNEINILVSMLKKEKAKNLNGQNLSNGSLNSSGYQSSNDRHRMSVDVRDSVSSNPGASQSITAEHARPENPLVSRESTTSNSISIANYGASNTSKQYSHKTTVNNIVQRKMGDMSVGRQEAFEVFKRDYRDREGIERKKTQLKQCYAQAKDKGQRVNQHRLNINELKAAMQHCRISAAVSSSDSGDAQGGGESAASEEERRLREKMEIEKEEYKKTFDELKKVKGEIEHIQHMLEQDKLLIVKEFESWWATQEQKQEEQNQHPGGFSGVGDSAYTSASTSHANISRDLSYDSQSLRGSTTSSASGRPRSGQISYGASDTKSSSFSAAPVVGSSSGNISGTGISPSIPLTGDAKADADIMAFFKARQKALGQANV